MAPQSTLNPPLRPPAPVRIAETARQVTFAPHDHILTNVGAWTPDGDWLVYDTRPATGAFAGAAIHRVHVGTGEVQILYSAPRGSHCGVVTASPCASRPRLVFIQGPEPETPDWSYAFSRRRGLVLELLPGAFPRPLEAATYAAPLIPGALRGGTHGHVFSGDGRWVSFTYDDNLLSEPDGAPSPSSPRETNQRNIGVATPERPVKVPDTHPRNHDGDWFSALVSRTVENPRPGSDEIDRACEEGWVGVAGYRRTDGIRQAKALAFQGRVTASDGRKHYEVFLLDLPDTLAHPGDAPLEGTLRTRPAPPRSVTQRRLTFTDTRPVPGLAQSPRHWLRSSPDGEHIAFLMQDAAGVIQLWTVSPRGGPPRQVTRLAAGISSAFTWSPDGRRLAAVADGSVCTIEIGTGNMARHTPRETGARAPLPDACVFSPDGGKIAWMRMQASPKNEYAQIFVTPIPRTINE